MASRRNSISSTSSILSSKSNLIRDISTDNLLTIDEKFTKQSINSKKKLSTKGVYYFPNGEVFKPRSDNHQKRSRPDKLRPIVPTNYRASILASSSAVSLHSLPPAPIPRSYSNPNFTHLPMDFKNSSFRKNPYAKDDMFKLQSNNLLKSNFDSSNQNISLQSLPEKENQGSSSLSSTSSTYSSSSSTSIELKNQLLPNNLSNIDKQMKVEKMITEESETTLRDNDGDKDSDDKLQSANFEVDTSPDSQSTPNDLIDGVENGNEISLKNAVLPPQVENFILDTDRKEVVNKSLELSFVPSTKLQSISEVENIHHTSHLHVTQPDIHEMRGLGASIESNNISPISQQKSLNNQMDIDNLLDTYDEDYIDDSPISHPPNDDSASPNLKTPVREHDNDNLGLTTPAEADIKSPIDQVFPTDEDNEDIDNLGNVPITPRKTSNTEMESQTSSLPSPDFRHKPTQDTHYDNFTANSNEVDDDVDFEKKDLENTDLLESKSGDMDVLTEKNEDDNENAKVPTQDLISKNEEQKKAEEEDDIPPRRDLMRRHRSLIIEDPDIPLRRDLQSGSIRNKRLSGLQEPSTPNRLSLSSSIVESPALQLAPPHRTKPQSKPNPIDYTRKRKPMVDSVVDMPRSISQIIPSSVPSTPTPRNNAIKKSASLPRFATSPEKAQPPSKPLSNFRLFLQRLFSKDSSKSTKTPSSKQTPANRMFGKIKQKGGLTAPNTPVLPIPEESRDVHPAVPPKDKPKKVKSTPVTVPVKIAAPIFDSPNLSLKPRTGPPKTSTGFTRKSNDKKGTEAKDFKFVAPNMSLRAPNQNGWKNDDSLTLTRLPSISAGSIQFMDDLMSTFDKIDDDDKPKDNKFLPLDIYDSTGHLKSTGTTRSVRSDIFLKDDELSIAQIKDQQIKDSANNGSSLTLDDDYVDDNIRFLQREFNWKDYDTNRFSVTQLESSSSDEEEVDYSKLYVSQKTLGNCEVVVINQDQLVNVFKKTSQRKRLPSQIKYIKQFQDFKTVKVDYQEYEDLCNSDIPQPAVIKSNSIVKTGKATIKKQVMFSNSISIKETFAPDMYKRYNKSVTQYTLTEPSEINKIKIELNNYKTNEMLVNELSQNNTHFFYS